MGVIIAIQYYSDILKTILMFLSICGSMGEITQPIYFVPTGIVGIRI